MGSSGSQIDKPQRGRPKRAELSDVNINRGAQSILNTKRASLPAASCYYQTTLTTWETHKCIEFRLRYHQGIHFRT